MKARILGAILLILVGLGCGTSAQSAHDVARVSVISVAGVAKLVDDACDAMVSNAVKEADYLSKAQMLRVLQTGTMCAEGLATARPLLEAAAASVDAVDGPVQWATACGVLKAVTALAKVVEAVRQVGGTFPAGVDQALTAGKYIGASCSAI